MKILILLIFLAFNANSSDELNNMAKDLSIDPTRSTAILEGIKQEILFQNLNFKTQQYIFKLLEEINLNTEFLDRNDVNHFFMSEIYKLTLSSNIIKEDKSQILESMILKSSKKLSMNKKKYSPYSNYIIKEFISDYSEFTSNGYLKMYYDGQLKSHSLKIKIQHLIKYTSGWIVSFNTLNVEDFNSLTKKHFLAYLDTLANKSRLFKFNKQKNSAKYNHIFQFKNLQYYQNIYTQSSSSIISKKTKSDQVPKAIDAIKDINIEVEDTASKEIDKLIENIEEKP